MTATTAQHLTAEQAHGSMRLLIVSSVRLLRDGLASMLEQRLGVHSVCGAANAEGLSA